ncbi:GPI anchored serine-threonine rich family protein [Streptomyces sp. O3]
MSLIDRLRSAAKGAGTVPGHPDASRTPSADAGDVDGFGAGAGAGALRILSPAAGDVWRIGQDVGVTWRLTGDAGHPCDIVLVRGEGERTEGVAELAVGVDPGDLAAWATVPDVPPGDGYAVALTSSDPLTVYSGRLTIVR